MDRKKLISYAFCFRGEYDKIIKAINADLDVPEIIIDNAITIFDDVYPKELLNHKYPPFVLFYKGNLDLLKEKKILIIHGGGFNWKNPDHFRVVYLPRIEVLKDATDKLADFLLTYRQQ